MPAISIALLIDSHSRYLARSSNNHRFIVRNATEAVEEKRDLFQVLIKYKNPFLFE